MSQSSSNGDNNVHLQIRTRAKCPHCLEDFAAEQTRWVAEHPDLEGEDPRLGLEQQLRFLPTRFTADGHAIDRLGATCKELACPKCHLKIPRTTFEVRNFFVSIAGEQASGKSYFLASMTWQLRNVMPLRFSLSFADADPESNAIVNQYEEQNFLNPDQETPVKLAKTEEAGHMYNDVRYGEQNIRYPKPFFFKITPTADHPSSQNSGKVSRLLVLYDNAGESFRPGADRSTAPVTRHMALSQTIIFLFDPTQDPRFREACKNATADPQVKDAKVTSNQEKVLNEIAARIRRHSGLRQEDKLRQPLIVAVTKHDAWASLLDEDLSAPPYIRGKRENWHALDMPRIERVSRKTKDLLFKFAPALVTSAQALSDNCYFIPVSATGQPPVTDENGIILGVRPKDLNPSWVEVPMLVALCRWSDGLIPFTDGPSTPEAPSGPSLVTPPKPNGPSPSPDRKTLNPRPPKAP